jgi:hypothetical protein
MPESPPRVDYNVNRNQKQIEKHLNPYKSARIENDDALINAAHDLYFYYHFFRSEGRNSCPKELLAFLHMSCYALP